MMKIIFLNIIPTCRCQIGPTACGIRSRICPAYEVHVTDVNTLGKWDLTGKHGISFDDVLDPDKQDYVAKDHFVDKYEGMVRLLAERQNP